MDYLAGNVQLVIAIFGINYYFNTIHSDTLCLHCYQWAF